MWEPFGTAPPNETASWRPGPNERGTLNILSACVLTLLLCAYTSLHMDIPEHKKTHWRHVFWRKSLWVCAALFAPEFIAFIAFRQWLFARALESQMKKLLSPTDADSAEIESNDLEDKLVIHRKELIHGLRVHSHFALMGGYAFDTSKADINLLPDERTRVTLMPAALRMLAKHKPDVLPDISVETIQDKSKANVFAKTLVCIQACWFIAQTVGRMATSHATSLLEMNTFLHAVCCLVIYIAWWSKPLDIEEPFLIDASKGDAYSICAWMVMESEIGRRQQRNKDSDVVSGKYKSTGCQLHYYLDIGFGVSSWCTDAIKRNLVQGRTEEALLERLYRTGLVEVYHGQKIHGFLLTVRFVSEYNTTVMADLDHSYTLLDQAEVKCLEIARNWREKSGVAWHFGSKEMVKAHPPLTSTPDKSLKQWLGSSWFSRQFVTDPSAFFWAGLVAAGGSYGGIHLLAWEAPFPTKTQRLLWIISCFIIMSPFITGIAVSLVLYCVEALLQIFKHLFCLRLLRREFEVLWVRLKDSFIIQIFHVQAWSKVKSWWRPLWVKYLRHYDVCTLFIFISLYSAARVFLVLECFINLAHLPDQVFEEPEWSQYIPHFGSG